MTKVAIVCAAGYKGIGWGFPDVPPVCPECLLPIGEQYGGTPIARICTQLSKLGWKSFVTVGRPGSRYTGILNKAVRNPESHFPPEALAEVADKPAWTYERFQYVAQYGIPLLMTEPDMKGSLDSVLQSLDLIGFDWWDTLATLLGDHIWTDEGLQSILAYKPSCQVVIPERTTVSLFTPETARLCRQLGDREKYRVRRRSFMVKSKRFWGDALLPPEGLEFEKHAPYCHAPSSDVCTKDIDTPAVYRYVTKEWLPTNG